jgi:hypothetical protein
LISKIGQKRNRRGTERANFTGKIPAILLRGLFLQASRDFFYAAELGTILA